MGFTRTWCGLGLATEEEQSSFKKMHYQKKDDNLIPGFKRDWSYTLQRKF
jgi:hypothetical protein